MEVADDLHPGDVERGDVGAQQVEVAVEGGVGDEVLARLEHDLVVALRAQRLLRRVQDQVRPDRERVDVGPERKRIWMCSDGDILG